MEWKVTRVESLTELMEMLGCSATVVAWTWLRIRLVDHLTTFHLLLTKLSSTVWVIGGHDHPHHSHTNILVSIVWVLDITIIMHIYLILLIHIHLNPFTIQRCFLCGPLQVIKKLTLVNSLSNNFNVISMMIWCKYLHTCAYCCNVWARHVEMWYYLA